MNPRILLTTGEPGGIGPDLCVQIAQKSWPCSITVVGDPYLLKERSELIRLPLHVEKVAPHHSTILHQPGTLAVWPVCAARNHTAGHLDTRNAGYILDTLATGARACFDGDYDALVTPPVHKGIINEAGFPFIGHTEYLAELLGGQPLMLFVSPGLRLALVTTHVPLRAVSDLITHEMLEGALRILHAELKKYYRFTVPRIMVSGLNPHAGEGGYLGYEEKEVIIPVLEKLRAEGFCLEGPVPADTLFLEKNLNAVDAVVVMYHDQGLPVLKQRSFGQSVNVTLGLPILRTSVDHGTALELAGTGRASSVSLESAIETALSLFSSRFL